MSDAAPKLMIIAGDISADRHAAKIVARLKQMQPDLEMFGAGGTEMKAQGMEVLFDCSEFAVLGIFEVINKGMFFYKMRKTLLKIERERKPDAVLLVDFGGFNINFATNLRKQNRYTDLLLYLASSLGLAPVAYRCDEKITDQDAQYISL
ncbi:MAG: hypothetical protein IPP57_20395 [Candidatus Obscuribacter sp.]|nr:hypothetical protein [Candidatus Obscuribacter sp.]